MIEKLKNEIVNLNNVINLYHINIIFNNLGQFDLIRITNLKRINNKTTL